MKIKSRFEKEIEEAQNRLEELKKEIEQKQEKQQNLKQNKEKFEKELKEKEEELANLTKKLSSKELEIENYKLQVEANIDKKYELQSEINSKEINFLIIMKKRQAQIKSEVASHISELDSTRLQKEDIAKRIL